MNKLITIILGLSTAIAFAYSAFASSINISNQWLRANKASSFNTAAYMDITNNSNTDDALIAVKTTLSDTTEIHDMHQTNGISHMVKVEKIDIPAHTTIHLMPGSLHIMLKGIRNPLTAGQEAELTLVFTKAGEIKIKLPVKTINKSGTN
jgi:copper(I)-binding protein